LASDALAALERAGVRFSRPGEPQRVASRRPGEPGR
jgi:hypothetical protein